MKSIGPMEHVKMSLGHNKKRHEPMVVSGSHLFLYQPCTACLAPVSVGRQTRTKVALEYNDNYSASSCPFVSRPQNSTAAAPMRMVTKKMVKIRLIATSR